MKKLSIIVPVYNVEKYIRTCVESIFRQGLSEDEFEVIIINDGTPDKSMDKIADIIEGHKNIQVINQQNKGISITRNNGINKAVGEYIVFVDSDDILVENSLPLLINEAQKAKADLVMADYIETNYSQESPEKISFPKEVDVKEKNGEKLFLQDMDPYDCHVWHFLFKKDFLKNNHISFIPNIIYEDIPFVHECFLKAQKCLRIKWPMYIYRKDNSLSLTSNFNKKSGMDLCIAIAKIWNFTNNNQLSSSTIYKIKQNVYSSFSVLTYCTIHDLHNNKERIEILRNIKQIAPNMQFKNGFRQKSTNFMYKKLPWTYVLFRVVYATCIEKQVRLIKKKHKKEKKDKNKINYHSFMLTWKSYRKVVSIKA